jgi:hypothetical protein
MRLALRSAIAAASLLALSAGISVAGAAPGPGGKGTGKFDDTVVYPADVTSCVPDFGCPSAASDTGDLVVDFDEGGQKRFVSVDYRLDATAAATWSCGTSGQFIGILYPASNTVTGLLPDDNGHVIGRLVLEVSESFACPQTLLREIVYTNVTVTNLTSGRVYRLDQIAQVYPT